MTHLSLTTIILLWLHEIGHIALYFLVVLSLRVIFKKVVGWKILIYGLAFTLLVDLDHLFDYFLTYGPVINLPLMLSAEYFHFSGRIIIPLHSLELAVIFLAAYQFAKRKGWYKGGQILLISAVTLFIHLAFDIFYYGFNPLVYFVTYRALHGFGIGLF